MSGGRLAHVLQGKMEADRRQALVEQGKALKQQSADLEVRLQQLENQLQVAPSSSCRQASRCAVRPSAALCCGNVVASVAKRQWLAGVVGSPLPHV